MNDIEKVGHDLLDYLVTINFVEICWDENGKDYYGLTELGFSAANMLFILNKKNDEDQTW